MAQTDLEKFDTANDELQYAFVYSAKEPRANIKVDIVPGTQRLERLVFHGGKHKVYHVLTSDGISSEELKSQADQLAHEYRRKRDLFISEGSMLRRDVRIPPKAMGDELGLECTLGECEQVTPGEESRYVVSYDSSNGKPGFTIDALSARYPKGDNRRESSVRTSSDVAHFYNINPDKILGAGSFMFTNPQDPSSDFMIHGPSFRLGAVPPQFALTAAQTILQYFTERTGCRVPQIDAIHVHTGPVQHSGWKRFMWELMYNEIPHVGSEVPYAHRMTPK